MPFGFTNHPLQPHPFTLDLGHQAVESHRVFPGLRVVEVRFEKLDPMHQSLCVYLEGLAGLLLLGCFLSHPARILNSLVDEKCKASQEVIETRNIGEGLAVMSTNRL